MSGSGPDGGLLLLLLRPSFPVGDTNSQYHNHEDETRDHAVPVIKKKPR